MKPLFRGVSVSDFDKIEVRERNPRIERVQCHEPIEGVVLCSQLYEIQLHYAVGHSRICIGAGECEFCKTHRLDSYFLCALHNSESRRTSWLQLPPNAAKTLLFGCKVLQRELFGTKVRIARQWKAMNAPVTVAVDPLQPLTDRLPKPITPEKAIERTFFSPKAALKPRKKSV